MVYLIAMNTTEPDLSFRRTSPAWLLKLVMSPIEIPIVVPLQQLFLFEILLATVVFLFLKRLIQL